MGSLQFIARASSSSLHTVFFVIRMKLTLCVIVLCFYLTLSAARTIPDRNDWENDADRTSHDSFSRYVSPYPSDTFHAPYPSDTFHGPYPEAPEVHDTLLADQYIPPPPHPPAPAPAPAPVPPPYGPPPPPPPPPVY